jgi:SNF2 family DNA or RNA helicase
MAWRVPSRRGSRPVLAVVVVDEAQNIKNPATAQTKAVKAIPPAAACGHERHAGGKPAVGILEHHGLRQAGYLGGLPHFVKEYATPIQTDHDAAAGAALPKRVTAPFLLRRLKSDKTIISDLPDKIEQDQHCSLDTGANRAV